MSEIGFYHLTRTGAADALAPLLGRTLEAGARALVLCRDADRVEALDAALWRAAEPLWLPHGTPRMGEPDLQPVWITDEPGEGAPPNGAGFLFLLDGRTVAEPGRFARVFDLFDGNDEAEVVAARQRWTALRAAGHAPVYWRQEQKGWTRVG